MRRLAFAVVALFAATTAFAADPAQALADAKAHLTAKKYAEALDAAAGGIEGAGVIPIGQRGQALAALNFYAAAAASGIGNDIVARLYLEEFARLSTMRKVDPAKFDAKFVKLFDAVLNSTSEQDQFLVIYPAYAEPSPAIDPSQQALIDAAAVHWLATKDEKRDWAAVSSGDARAEFMKNFWAKRDLTPGTATNEYRTQIERRIAFADKYLISPDAERGSLSDRGRVFILLGRPTVARRRPIGRDDLVSMAGTTEINKQVDGTMEQWIYQRAQLPVAYSKPSVTYRFVTQRGLGDNVLQKNDAWSMNALSVAANPQLKP